MVPLPITGLPLIKNALPEKSEAQLQCEANGGKWDGTRCILPEKKEEQKIVPSPFVPDLAPDREGTKPNSVITLPDGRTFSGLGTEEITNVQEQQPLAITNQTSIRQQQLEERGQQLSGQVGQIDPSTGLQATDISQKEALTAGVVDAIPSAIRLAGQAGIAAGAVGAIATAPIGGIGAVPAAAIGGAIGFVAGITGGMISNMKSQRRDTTTAQQRVLDEGKQTLKDWSTLAKADPANKEEYLSQFNQQLQIIQDAHTQMLIDVNADVAKFETAIPNLAEFDSFYSVGGERDALIQEMQVSLQTPSTAEYEMLALAERRK